MVKPPITWTRSPSPPLPSPPRSTGRSRRCPRAPWRPEQRVLVLLRYPYRHGGHKVRLDRLHDLWHPWKRRIINFMGLVGLMGFMMIPVKLMKVVESLSTWPAGTLDTVNTSSNTSSTPDQRACHISLLSAAGGHPCSVQINTLGKARNSPFKSSACLLRFFLCLHYGSWIRATP